MQVPASVCNFDNSANKMARNSNNNFRSFGSPLSVTELKELNWNSMSLEEKFAVKMRGRPMPPVVLTGEYYCSNRPYIRKAIGLDIKGRQGLYSKCNWICGCDKTNKFFCFPCLLLRKTNGPWNIWNDKGAGGVTAIYNLIQRHDENVKHKENVISLAMLQFGSRSNLNPATVLSNKDLTLLRRERSEISRNREKLSVIINQIRFCSTLEMALKETVEQQDSSKHKLLMTQELELVTRTEMEKCSWFQNKQKEVISDLLEAMLNVYLKKVHKELSQATHLSFVVNELSEFKSSDLALLYRFADSNGLVVEHFWGFHKPINFSADCVAAMLKQELALFIGQEKKKLVGQRYDDTTHLSGLVNEVQAEIQKEYPRASYFPCPCRDYDHAIQLASRAIQKANVFFISLQSISSYFLNSTERTIVLATTTLKQMTTTPQIKWERNSSNVNTVYKHQHILYECCTKLTSNVYSSATVEGAINIQRTLDDEEFCFWLGFFHRLMLHAEFLFKQLELQYRGTESCNKLISEFLHYVTGIQDDIKNDRLPMTSDDPKRKRMCTDEESVKSAAIEVCDLIHKEISQRLQTTPYMELAALFANDRPELAFELFKKNFPTELLEKALENYPELNKGKVENELKLLYACNEFNHTIDSIPILTCLVKNGTAEEDFCELMPLLKIVSTIPISSKERDPYFSKMTQIKNFLSNTVHENNVMSALVVLAVERDFLIDIPDFNHRVIQQFASLQSWQMYFQYSDTWSAHK